MLALHDSNQASRYPIAEHIAAHCRDSRHPDRVARILRLAEAQAWTDAALTLLEMERPQWELRRLVHEDGEWFCALSRRPHLPIELDDCAEAHNELLVRAILDALGEAREKDRAVQVPLARRSALPPTVTPTCDNFG